VSWLYLLVAIIAEVAATSALKASQGFTNPAPSAVVALGYGTAFYFLSLSLDSIPLGVAYAVWAGAGIVLIALAGLIVYGQKLDGFALLGIGFILVGVLVIHLLSDMAA
jgi:multidrug transporter EmrE-like cation transporter